MAVVKKKLTPFFLGGGKRHLCIVDIVVKGYSGGEGACLVSRRLKIRLYPIG